MGSCLENIYNRNMPPANVPQPLDAEITSILSWIEGAAFDHLSQIDPGHVVLRRLNRSEYENTIHDLFGIKIDAQKYLLMIRAMALIPLAKCLRYLRY